MIGKELTDKALEIINDLKKINSDNLNIFVKNPGSAFGAILSLYHHRLSRNFNILVKNPGTGFTKQSRNFNILVKNRGSHLGAILY